MLVNIQSSTIQMALGCVISPPGPSLAAWASSRNLGPVELRISVETASNAIAPAGTAIVRVNQGQPSEMARLLPQRCVATAQTQTEHNEECGCKAITTAVGNGSSARCADEDD